MVSSNMPRKTKIFVGRLPENCRNDELRQLFLRYGEVTECDVMNRYGFVHMAREEDAAAAIKALHNTNFKGATINVEQSTGKSRGGGPGGRRDDRRGGPMRGGRGGGGGGGGGRDGGRDGGRPGPYNDRRGNLKPLKPFSSGVGGYSDYGNRGGGGYGDRGGDYGGPGGGYGDRGGYGQNVGGGAMGGYSSSAPGMGGGYGPAAGGVGGYGPSGGGMGGDFNRGVPGVADYGRADNFGTGRSSDPYSQRNDYDRSAAGPMRNGGGGGAVSAGGYGSGYTDVGQYGRPMGGGPSYNAGAPSYNSGPGPQTDMFSRRPGNAVASGGYPPVGGGYSEAYDRPDAYGPPRGGGRFPGPADAMPPRY